jgi:hypothetical protein
MSSSEASGSAKQLSKAELKAEKSRNNKRSLREAKLAMQKEKEAEKLEKARAEQAIADAAYVSRIEQEEKEAMQYYKSLFRRIVIDMAINIRRDNLLAEANHQLMFFRPEIPITIAHIESTPHLGSVIRTLILGLNRLSTTGAPKSEDAMVDQAPILVPKNDPMMIEEALFWNQSLKVEDLSHLAPFCDVGVVVINRGRGRHYIYDLLSLRKMPYSETYYIQDLAYGFEPDYWRVKDAIANGAHIFGDPFPESNFYERDEDDGLQNEWSEWSAWEDYRNEVIFGERTKMCAGTCY